MNLSARPPAPGGPTKRRMQLRCAALIDNSEQLGVQCDLGIEDLGNRAVLLGVAGHPSECGFV
jgi:hypothetical protein